MRLGISCDFYRSSQKSFWLGHIYTNVHIFVCGLSPTIRLPTRKYLYGYQFPICCLVIARFPLRYPNKQTVYTLNIFVFHTFAFRVCSLVGNQESKCICVCMYRNNVFTVLYTHCLHHAHI